VERDLTTPATRVEEKSDEAVATVSEIVDPQTVKHLAASFSPTQITHGRYDSLPYHQLGGAGLERLCYSLILARGGVPRYFGHPGQEQYGIDLVVSDGVECVVYQCKNVNAFTRRNMAEALQLFEEKWLGHPKLPSPTKFVLCCPLPLRERKLKPRPGRRRAGQRYPAQARAPDHLSDRRLPREIRNPRRGARPASRGRGATTRQGLSCVHGAHHSHPGGHAARRLFGLCRGV
jgi:hypothetical protein